MSTEARGRVVGVFEKDWQGTKLYSFKVNNKPMFFRLGKSKPEFSKGDIISFTERNNNVEPSSIVIESTSTEAVPEETPEKNEEVDSLGDRIRYQAARRDAVSLIVAALQTDHLPHSANTAKGKRLGLLLGYVKEVTGQLLEEEQNR